MVTFAQGIEAAEGILRRTFRVEMAKALDPTNPHHLIVIEQRLADAIRGKVGPAQAAAMREALETLDVNWKALSADEHFEVISAARRALYLPAKVVEHSISIMTKVGQQVVTGTKKGIEREYKLGIDASFNQVDYDAVQHAAFSQGLYFRNSEGKRLDQFAERARIIVARGIEQGLGRQELSKELKGALDQHANRSDAYWTMLAGVYVNRSRTFANLSSYQEGGISRYTFHAVMDEVTSAQCRFMNGKSFDVGSALDKYGEVQSSSDPEDVQFIQPWLQVGRDKESGDQYLYTKDKGGGRTRVADVTRNAVGIMDEAGSFKQHVADKGLEKLGCVVPPLHGHCRSTLLPDMTSATIGRPDTRGTGRPRGRGLAPPAPPPPPPPPAPPPPVVAPAPLLAKPAPSALLPPTAALSPTGRPLLNKDVRDRMEALPKKATPEDLGALIGQPVADAATHEVFREFFKQKMGLEDVLTAAASPQTSPLAHLVKQTTIAPHEFDGFELVMLDHPSNVIDKYGFRGDAVIVNRGGRRFIVADRAGYAALSEARAGGTTPITVYELDLATADALFPKALPNAEVGRMIAASLDSTGKPKANAEVREAVRGLLAQEGIYSRDVARGLDAKGFKVGDKRLQALRANGVHEWSGEIGVTGPVARDLKQSAQMLEKNNVAGLRTKMNSGDALPGLCVAVHEELHACSVMMRSAYQAQGQIVEEAVTELAARHFVRKLCEVKEHELSQWSSLAAPRFDKQSQKWVQPTGAYGNYLGAIYDAAHKAGIPEDEVHERVTQACLASRRLGTVRTYSPGAHVDNFGEHLFPSSKDKKKRDAFSKAIYAWRP